MRARDEQLVSSGHRGNNSTHDTHVDTFVLNYEEVGAGAGAGGGRVNKGF